MTDLFDHDLETQAISTIRALALDMVEEANSGHPGTALALAPLAHVLWTDVLKTYAPDPEWPDRDRFVLSIGHASALIYAMNYLIGTGLTLDDLRNFRQVGSKTPGHPEVGHTPGIDVTTGPLGQGIGNAVGMALAERHLRARLGPDTCNHYVFGICGDGDLQEGISHEAASLAGHQQLGRLIFVYDDNRITIDGSTDLSMSDNTAERFRAYGWHVEELGEVANDTTTLRQALLAAKQVEDRPSLLILRSHIGYPSEKMMDTAAAHGAPFGPEETKATKCLLGKNPDESFAVPEAVLNAYRAAGKQHQATYENWTTKTKPFTFAAPGIDLTKLSMPEPAPVGASIATREALSATLTALQDQLPGLISGGCDLTGNTGALLKGAEHLTPAHPQGTQMHWGIREHGAAAAIVGMAQHGGVLPTAGTFLIFSDYQKPSVRLAAMSKVKALFIWSHDSVGLGEDGPTHQPIEQLATLRAIPQLTLWRPADANESTYALAEAIKHDGPSGLILSRQKLPVLEGTSAEGVAKGGYVLQDPTEANLTLIGTGSEVALCVAAAAQLHERGVNARVVSLVSWERFAEQPEDYQQTVLKPSLPTLSVEAASTFGWSRYADDSIGIDTFGESGPGSQVLEHFGFTKENVVERALRLLKTHKKDH